jgi:hypothetical protein
MGSQVFNGVGGRDIVAGHSCSPFSLESRSSAYRSVLMNDIQRRHGNWCGGHIDTQT